MQLLVRLLTGLALIATPPVFAQCVSAQLDSPQPGVPGREFGEAVAFEGDTLVVGSSLAEVNSVLSGLVYVYERQAGSWTQVQVLSSPNPFSGHSYGAAVALRGDVLMVGATGGNGVVYAYRRIAGTWEFDEELVPEGGGAGWSSGFGSTIVLDEGGDDVIIAEPDHGGSGHDHRFYHFRDQTMGWKQKAAIDPGGNNNQDVSGFAWSLHLDWPRLFVGNQRDTLQGNFGGSDGAVYVYEFSADTSWVRTQTLRLPQAGSNNAQLGASLDLRGDELAVGATFHIGNGSYCGAVTVWREQPDGTWTYDPADLIVPADGQNVEYFGTQVKFTPTHLAVSSWGGGLIDFPGIGNGGSLYLYEGIGGEWRLSSEIAPTPVQGWGYGQSLALSGSELAVGDPDIYNDAQAGTVWILDHDLGGVSRLCVPSPNSAGSGAKISSLGFPSIGTNDFTLSVSGAPANQFGKFFYGPGSQNVPFGNGLACVSGGSTGLFRLLPATTTDASGSISRLLDFTQPPASSGPGAILAGSTWYFQFWYRDPAAGGAFFNLSDALRVGFCL